MKTFLRVKLFLVPLLAFLIAAAQGHALPGALAGLAWSAGASLLRRGLQPPPPFEAALMAGFALAAIGLAAAAADAAQGIGIVMGCLSAGAIASVLRGRPWTAEFSAAEFGGASATPLFVAINETISALWGALFGWLAVAAWLALPPPAHWLPLAGGALASILLPRLLVARGLRKMAAGDTRYDWPPPDLRASHPAAPGEGGTADVAVIGAGIGGLTAAALLADAGLRVEVFEQHDVPGGFSHTWLRRARVRDPQSGEPLVFRFDSGVHDVSGWHPGGTVRSVFERLGIAREDEWVRLDHRYMLDGRTLDVPRDWRAWVERLAAEFPHEAAGLRALFGDIHAVYEAMFSTAAERGGIPGTPGTPRALLEFALRHPLAVAWLDRPWQDFVERHVRDRAVQAWIGALAGYVTDDIARLRVRDIVPIFGYYFEGGYYPLGGSGLIARRLVEAIEARGGRVHLRTEVLRIVTGDGAAKGVVVRGQNGPERSVQARAVITNADLGQSLTRLLPRDEAPPGVRELAGRLQPTCSAMGVSLAVKGMLAMPPIVHVEGAGGAVSIVIPSQVDPGCAPPGHSTVELLALMRPDEAQAWFADMPADDRAEEGHDHRAYRRSAPYLARKQAAGDRLIALARQAIPDLDQRIIYRTDASPLTFQRYAWATGGAIYGMRSHGAIPTKSPVRNLVVAGAATHGPGIEAVVISGAYAAEALLPGLLARAAPPTPA
ncbi:phytoene desaturase family protein [Thauera sinica]|uniref:Phytoene desaturase family protein n=1 Tax=Thauera sinica TaxID=2665146 RepID=A0ABW1AVC6_9RHOO|nr:NAD(P)/FAD-dependent oxidoreductase [Thauera sp. K11]